MDQKTVQTLEQELEAAIAALILRPNFGPLPLLPDRRTMHLMAKAATAVYEAAAEQQAR